EILERDSESLARLITLEMGKPIGTSREEISKCEYACRFYAEQAGCFLADEVVETSAASSSIRYEPLGPILTVTTWNFPFWQVFRVAAPALMAGNVCLVKHAPNVPQCAIAIEDIFHQAGAPSGLFQQ